MRNQTLPLTDDLRYRIAMVRRALDIHGESPSLVAAKVELADGVLAAVDTRQQLLARVPKATPASARLQPRHAKRRRA